MKMLKNPALLKKKRRQLLRLLDLKGGQALLKNADFLFSIPNIYYIDSDVHDNVISDIKYPGIRKERRERLFVHIPLKILKEFL